MSGVAIRKLLTVVSSALVTLAPTSVIASEASTDTTVPHATRVRLVVSTSTWLPEPFDFRPYAQYAVEKVSFEVVAQAATAYEATVRLDCVEHPGREFPFARGVLGVGPVIFHAQGTKIDCTVEAFPASARPGKVLSLTAADPLVDPRQPITAGTASEGALKLRNATAARILDDSSWRALGWSVASSLGLRESLIARLRVIVDDWRREGIPVRQALEALEALRWEPTTQREQSLLLLLRWNFAALANLGQHAVDLLIDALRHHDPNLRMNAAETLARIGDVRAIAPLTDMARNDPSDAARKAAKGAVMSLREQGRR